MRPAILAEGKHLHFGDGKDAILSFMTREFFGFEFKTLINGYESTAGNQLLEINCWKSTPLNKRLEINGFESRALNILTLNQRFWIEGCESKPLMIQMCIPKFKHESQNPTNDKRRNAVHDEKNQKKREKHHTKQD